MRFAAPLLLAGLVVTAGSATASPVPLMLLPFGDVGEEQKKLYDAVELELELSEDLVLSPVAPLFDELGDHDVQRHTKDEIANALTFLEQQGLVFAYFPPDATRAVIVLFRTHDASIVFARDVVIQDAAWKPREQVVDPMLTVLRDMRAAPPLTAEEVAKLGIHLGPADPAGGEGEGEGEAPPDGTQAPVDPPPPTETPPDEEPAAAAERPPGTDRVGRLMLGYAPQLLHYRACNPSSPGPAPFLCTPAAPNEATEVLVNPLQSPVGFAIAGEAFVFETFGLVFDASFFQAQLAVLANGQRSTLLRPNPFNTFGGNATVALAARGSFGVAPGVGLSLGGRAGYQLSWAQSDATELIGGVDVPVQFTVLPTWYSHRGMLGGSLVLGVGEIARVFTDLDLLFGYHPEGLTRVGDNPFGFGGRAQLGVDIHLFAGAFVRLAFDGSAFNVNTTGLATEAQPRRTFSGVTFENGQIRLLEARGVIGVGFAY